MADANFENFDKRLARIMRNHQRLSKGYVTAVTNDGLIVARPRRRIAPFVPWRSILGLLMLGLACKVLLFVNLGPQAYGERVARLSAGTEIEQAGAYLMSADRATLWLAGQIESLKH